ncbi:MAG: pilus assembly protein TadB [Clostridia bacterium]|nr:pilus assembly protein TadB [Clostridia bacterium]
MGLEGEVREEWQNGSVKNEKLTDYDIYIMPFRDKVLYTLLAAVVIFFITLIFYHNISLSMLFCPMSLIYPRLRTKEIISKRKCELNLQFKDMLYAISSSLSAGKSVESAFKDALRDLEIIYPGSDTSIITEVDCIVKKIGMNETVESALGGFAARSHLEDVKNFADVFYTCKRTGGNIIEVIKNTSNLITDKIETKQEIDIMLAQRRFEHKVLNILPVFMILLLSTSAADYMRPVFSDIAGRIAMTFSIMLLAMAYFISKKIMDIRV